MSEKIDFEKLTETLEQIEATKKHLVELYLKLGHRVLVEVLPERRIK